ncbi:MAG: hypothetical protein C0179_08160 [Fervidicoccus sp.]|nr:MAG: hypothetical protein C0179_08160 [Fervidicoccus sp.]
MKRLVLKSFGMRGFAIEVLSLFFILIFSYSLISITSSVAYAPFYIAEAGGGGELLYSSSSTLVYTGLVPSSLYTYLLNVTGGQGISPEVSVPILIDGKAVIARGIEVGRFVNCTDLKVIEGGLNLSNGGALVGERVADGFKLKVGDQFTALSAMSNRSLTFFVVGIISGSAVSDEVLISIDDARYLRGINDEMLSYIRVCSQSPEVMNAIGEIGNSSQEREGISVPSWLLSLASRFSVSSTLSGYSTRISKNIEEAERVTLIASLSVSVALSSILAFSLSGASISSSSSAIKALRDMGMRKRDVLKSVAVEKSIAFSSSLILSIASYLLMEKMGIIYAYVLEHRIPPSLSWIDAMIYTIAVFSIYIAISLRRAEVILNEI